MIGGQQPDRFSLRGLTGSLWATSRPMCPAQPQLGPLCLVSLHTSSLLLLIVLVSDLNVLSVVNLNVHHIPDLLHRVGGQPRLDRQPLGLACLEVEAAIVLWALHEVALDHQAVGKDAGAVGAFA